MFAHITQMGSWFADQEMTKWNLRWRTGFMMEGSSDFTLNTLRGGNTCVEGSKARQWIALNFIRRLKFPLLFHCITVSGSGWDSFSGISNLLTYNPNFLLTSISMSMSSMNLGTMGHFLASSLVGGSVLGLTCCLDWVWTCSSGSSSLSGTSGCSRCLWVQEKEEEDVYCART